MSERAFNVGRVAEAVERAEQAMFDALNTAASYLDHDEPDVATLIHELRLRANYVRELTGAGPITEVRPGGLGFSGDETKLSPAGQALERLVDRAYENTPARPEPPGA